MRDLDDAVMKRIFQQLNLVVAGESTLEGLVAVQSLYCAMLCIASADAKAAADLAGSCHEDVQRTIRNDFDWYKSQLVQQPNAPAGRG